MISQDLLAQQLEKTKIVLGINSIIISKIWQIQSIALNSFLTVFMDKGDTLFTYNHKLAKINNKVHLKLDYHLPEASLITFSSKYKSIFILFNNSNKIAVLDYDLIFIDVFEIDGFKHTLMVVFLDTINCFVLLKPQKIQILGLEIFTNHTRKTGLPISYQMNLLANLRVKSKIRLSDKLIKGSQSIVLIHNNDQIELLDLSNSSNKMVKVQGKAMKNLCSLPDVISCITLINERKVIIVGYSYGLIKGYKVGQDEQLFSFNYHSKRVLSIYSPNPNFIMSVGLDDLVQVIQLETMQNTETFKLSQHCKYAQINSKDALITVSANNQLIYNSISLKHHLIYHHKSQFRLSLVLPNQHIIIFSDNSIYSITNPKIDNSFIPPKCKEVLSLVLNPWQTTIKQYWLLTDSSQIYKYQQTKEGKTKIVSITKLGNFKDKFQRFCFYTVNLIVFCKSVPLLFDGDAREKAYFPNHDSFQSLMPICLGTKQGSIIIVPSNNTQMIICKISPFLSPLQTIINLSSSSSHTSLLVSYSQGQINAFQLYSTKQPTLIYSFNFQENFWLKQLSNIIFGIVDSNNLILSMYSNHQLYSLTQTPIHHQSAIACISFEETNQQIIVGDQHGIIYIWTINITLRVKIYISEKTPIQYTGILNQALIFGYNQKIYSLLIPNVDHKQKVDQKKWIKLKKIYNEDINKKEQQKKEKVLQRKEKQMIKNQNVRKKDYSLPSIKSRSGISSASINGDIQKYDPTQIKRKKRSSTKNSNYQSIFHFPTSTLYEELIKLKIIQ